jgi:putative NIF3 family GTP cyclohydrolase 1 type 2
MKEECLSRRSFVWGGAAIAASTLAFSQDHKAKLAADEVVGRIKSKVGIPWREQTVDRIVGGSGTIPVRGIATTMMATLDVLQRASAAGKNLVITHEPTFYSHQDTTDELRSDPTYQYKQEFIRKNEMAVFRFHDHWHARTPDGIALGMTRELGWEQNVDPQNQKFFKFPAMNLGDLVDNIRKRLSPHSMRVLGDPRLEVRNVMASWGYVSGLPGIDLLARQDVDVLIGGETREWEVVEYAQDAIASGKKKALILLGHVVSEQAGMKVCAEWLKTIFPEIPIEFVAATDPFWKN